MMRSGDTLLHVVAVESIGASHAHFQVRNGEVKKLEPPIMDWDCGRFFDDPTGLRLVEEIIRRIRIAYTDHRPPDMVAISLPGTINGVTTVERSTRLGILQPINISNIFKSRNMPNCYILHDTECLALGEARYGALRNDGHLTDGHEQFAYIYAHEGIGATLFVDGQVFRGAGSAGRIGRLVVAPEGPYNRKFMSRGPLELFAARPWISTNIVGALLAEIGKVGETTTGDRTFRAWVAAASKANWDSLTLEQIARGISQNDPVAITVMEEAARYLGIAVHAILTVMHPPAIVLGGGMISDLPGFYEAVTSHARRFSYHLAWNKTIIRQASLGREAQFLGALQLLLRLPH